jgi:transposase
MSELSIIGLDLAKNSFQLHGAQTDGKVAFRKKLTRAKVLPFLCEQPRSIVAMEACGSSHHWAREIGKLGHEVRLIPPVYVKPFVKRQKNDAADAEAIAEAASRPAMRTVAVKTEEQQALCMLFRTRDMFVHQRTQLINALRGHLAEHGVIASQGAAKVGDLENIIEDPNTTLPALVIELAREHLEQIEALSRKIDRLGGVVEREARREEISRRLQTMPGVGPVTAMAILAFAPPLEEFRRGRDFAAWLGLVPRQHSTGGKQCLGRTSKMGQRDIRTLLIIGATGLIRWARRKGAPEGSWLARMLARKPPMLVAVALANKMARGIWAMITRQENYKASGAVTT